jgi:hypothetical protein
MKQNRLFYRNSLLPKLFMLVMLLVGGGNYVWGETLISGGTVDLDKWAEGGKYDNKTYYSYNKNTTDGYIETTYTNAALTSKSTYSLSSSQKIIFNAKKYSNSAKIYVRVSSNGSDWTEISPYPVTTSTSPSIPTDYDDVEVSLSTIESGCYYLQFFGYCVTIKSIILTDAPTPTLSVDPSDNVAFGTVWVDATKTDYYTITNNSEKSVNVVAAISGTDAASFSVSPSEAQDIAAGETQTYSISYTYNSSELGEKSATITFTPDGDNTNAITKNISATAVSNFTISSTDGAFGNVTADANKVYTITNNTGSPVTISPSIEGSGMFSVSPNEDTEIANGSSQDFTVSFDWEADLAKFGEKTATISFTPDNGDDSFVISASATATADLVIDEAQATTWTSGSGKSVWVKYQPQNGWNTIILPFPTSSNLASIFGSGAVAYQLNSFSDEGVLSFSKTDPKTYIGANVPCLVYIENAPDNSSGVLLTGIYVFQASNAIPGSVSKSNSDSETATFKGTFAPIAAPGMAGKYGVTTAGKLGKGSDKASIKGYRAYIETSNPEARLSMVIDDDGETTDLGFVRMVDKDAKDVYNLQGQKVKKSGKGIYVVNGRKVVIK